MKFALILMIKNEEKILKRCLDAIKDLVDCYCIFDTGSTDNTVEIAKEYLKTSIGCIAQEPFRDFGYSRTQSFLSAQTFIREKRKCVEDDTKGEEEKQKAEGKKAEEKKNEEDDSDSDEDE